MDKVIVNDWKCHKCLGFGILVHKYFKLSFHYKIIIARL